LRLKTTTIDYAWQNYAGTEWIPLGSFTEISYTWYAPNIKVAVMTMLEMEWMPGFYTVNYLVDYNFPVGIEEQQDIQLEIFPNPSTDRVTIKSNERIDHVNIYSLTGQQMEAVSSTANLLAGQSFDVSTYPNGIYLVKVKFNDGSLLSRRIIKQ
jgi:hypothetical protein